MLPSYYWPVLTILLGIVGTIFKLLVWGFWFNKRETLNDRLSPEIAKTQDSIHERKLLPKLADIIDTVIARKKLWQAGPTITVLNEISIDVRVRDVIIVVSEKFALDRSFEGLHGLCKWVATSWLIAIISCVVLFFVYHHVPVEARICWIKFLLVVLTFAFLVGVIVLFLFSRAYNKLNRILRDYQF